MRSLGFVALATLATLACAGAFACSRSELFDFDGLAGVGLGPDGGSRLDAEVPPDASDDALPVKLLTCAEIVHDVCGGDMYQPGAPWPTYQRCSSHTSRGTAIGPKKPVAIWSQWTSMTTTVFGPPTITADGTIYVSPFGGLSAFTRDGTFRFNAGPNGYGPSTGGPVLGGPNAFGTSPVAIGPDGTAYAAADAVYAVNPDGSQRWTSSPFDAYVSADYGLGATSGSSVTLGPCGILDVATPTALVAFDPRSGGQLWNHPDSVTSTPAVDSDGNIFYQTLANDLVSLTEGGKLRWTFSPPDASSQHLPWIQGAPVLGLDGIVYFSEISGLYAVSKTGALLWELPWTFDAQAGVAYLATALGADGTLYAVAPDSTLCAVSPDGIEKWSLSIGASGTAPVIDGAGTIYELGTYGLNAITPAGAIAWTYPLQLAPNGGLAMGADGTLYVSAYGLYAIGERP